MLRRNTNSMLQCVAWCKNIHSLTRKKTLSHSMRVSRGDRLLQLAARSDWLVLAAIAPLMLFPERFGAARVSLALIVLLLVWFVRYAATRHFFPASPLDIPVLCLLLTIPLSLYASVDFATSLPKLTGLLFSVAVYYVVVRMSAERQTFPPVLAFWFASALAIALVSLLGIEWSSKFALVNQITNRLPRLVSGLSRTQQGGLHPNEVGGLLALFIPLVVSALLTRRVRSEAGANHASMSRVARLVAKYLYPDQLTGKIIWGVALLFFGGLLVLTQSRSALFGTLVAIALIGAVRSKALRWLGVVGIIAAIIAIAVIGPTTLGDLLLGGEAGSPATGNLDFEGRREVWSRALYAIQDFPFTGVGLNQFQTVANLLYPFFLIGPDAQVIHAHDIYLQVAVDFGLGGLVAYTALLMVGALSAIYAYRSLTNNLERALALGLGAGLLAHQLYGLSDAITLGAKPSFEWWMFLGMIVGLSTRAKGESHVEQNTWRISALEVFGIWILMSLIAIANVGDNALLGVGLALLGGCALGLSAYLQFRGRARKSQKAEGTA